MITLELDNETALLIEASIILFLESLVGSKGAIEAVKKSSNNLDESTIEQMDKEISEANFAIDKLKDVLTKFDIPENTDIDETIRPDFL